MVCAISLPEATLQDSLRREPVILSGVSRARRRLVSLCLSSQTMALTNMTFNCSGARFVRGLVEKRTIQVFAFSAAGRAAARLST